MNISIRHISPSKDGSAGIEMTVELSGASMTEDITDLNGLVDKELIDSLIILANDLMDQNILIENKLNKQ